MKSNFEKMVFIRKLPYWLFWTLFGFGSFVIAQSLFLYFHEKQFLVSLIIASFTLAFLPTFNIWLSYSFKKLISEVAASIWDTLSRRNEGNYFNDDFISGIFTLKLPISKIVTSLIMVPGIVTIFFLGFPFRSTTMNVLGLSAFLILLWFCGQTLYISFALLFALSKIVDWPVKVPFMLIPNPAIAKLQGFYSLASLSITFMYILLVVAIWQGPYGLHTVMLVWLTLLALYPGSMLVWSFFQIHNLLQKIKYSYITTVNVQIQRALGAVKTGNSINGIERLDKLIKIQSEVQRVNEWPIAVGGGITIVITVFAALAQIIVSIRQVFP